MRAPSRPPPYKDMLLVAGVLLIALGIGNWLIGALRAIPHSQYLRLHPGAKVESESFKSELLEPADDDREERDVARAKLEFYQLVQSGGRFMVVLGAVSLVGGWAARKAPRYPNLTPTGRNADSRGIS